VESRPGVLTLASPTRAAAIAAALDDDLTVVGED
jgi:hypothetical protein